MIRRLCTLIVAMVLASSVPAAAQEFFRLSEPTTVIRHQSEPLQWTPESVTVLTAGQLNETYRGDLEDLEAVVPGLLIDSLAGTPRGAAISMRGVGSAETGKGFFPAVAVTVDGVYIGTPASQNQLLFDVDRVEVARGPQPIWASAPAPGGAIDLYRTLPTGRLSAKTRATFGAFDRKRFDTVINFPVLSNLAGKFTFNWRRGGEGVVKNINTGRRENEEQLGAGSLSLLWHSHLADVQYTYDRNSDKSTVPALLNLSTSGDLVCMNSVAQANCSVDGQGRVPETGSYRLTSQGYSNERTFKATQHTLHVDFGLAPLKIKSITALRKTDETSAQDLDGTSADFYSSTNRQHYRQFSQEIDVANEPAADFSWVAGTYLLNADYALSQADLYVLKAISDNGSILPVAADAERNVDAHQTIRLRSLFAHATRRLDAQWIADIGVRSTAVSTHFHDTVSQPNPASGAFVVPPVILGATHKSGELSGSAGLSYKVDDNDMIYMRYSHAFRPGGFDDSVNSVDAASPFGDEHVDSYELGLKSRWFNDAMRFEYVIYRQDYKSKLERYTARLASGRVESLLRNVSYVRTFGHEIEIEAVVLDNLLLRASLNHTNSDYIDYRIPDFTGAASFVDLQDLVPAMTPPDQYHLSLLYRLPYSQGRFTLYAGYRFTTSYWSNPHIPAGQVSTFTIMDLSVDYDWRNWKVRLFSQNINDRRYLTNAQQTRESQVASLDPTTTIDQGLMTTTGYSRPRFNGIEVIYNWSGAR